MANPDKPSSIYDPTPVGGFTQCRVFKRTQILTHPLGGSMIAWELWPGQRLKGPFHFYVDFGRSGAVFGDNQATVDEWETINASPVVDTCVYFDPSRRNWDHLADYYYRIRLICPNELDENLQPRVFKAQPEHAGGFLSKRDWLNAREICRKEYLVMNKRTNLTARGFLVKRKRWGTPCPTCRDFDTGEVTNGGCLVCFGTGIVGGYYPGVNFTTIFMDPYTREFRQDPVVSTTAGVTRNGRAVAYPYIDTNDLFVRRDNGERYYVNPVKVLAEISGVPLVVNLQLRLAPNTDIAYTVPIIAPAPSSSSSSDLLEEKTGLEEQAAGPNWGNGTI